MIKVTITGMTIEIPDSTGLVNALIGAVAGTTVAGTQVSVDTYKAERDLLGHDEPETPYEAESTGKDELEEKRKAEEAAKRSEASKKAAATKKANEEAKAKEEADKKAAAQKAALEDDAPAEGAITQADVKARFTELIDKDIDIIPILAHFGATKISLLDPARYGEVMEHVKGM